MLIVSRLVNTHVVLSTFMIYSMLNLCVRGMMMLLVGSEFLPWVDWIKYAAMYGAVATWLIVALIIAANMVVFKELQGKERLEMPKGGLSSFWWSLPVHPLSNLVDFTIWS